MVPTSRIIINICVFVVFFQEELDLTAVHKKAMFELPPEKKWQLYLSKKKVSNAKLEENTLNQRFFETCWYYAQHIVRTHVYTILILPMLKINGCHVWWSSCGKLQIMLY